MAAGAVERPIAFQNNDRPGIMTAGAVRSYLNRWGVASGKAISVFTNNDDAHRTAMDMQAAGVHVVAVIDSRTNIEALGDYNLIKGTHVCDTTGRKGLESISVRTNAGLQSILTDCLAMSGG